MPRGWHHHHQQQQRFPLYGLLDEFEAAGNESSSSTSTDSGSGSSNSIYETLFEDLVFSTNDPRIGVQDRWDKGCSDIEFINYLTSKMEDADDEEEKQAYQDLVNVVEEVRKEKDKAEAEILAAQAARDESKRQREEEIAQSVEEQQQQQQQQKASSDNKRNMSAAEVLKAASQIEQGIMTASKEALEEEGPSDFMRDAKATVGLSGFNNKGRMRVGGS